MSRAVVGLEAASLNEWEHGEETGQSIDHPSAALWRNSTPRATVRLALLQHAQSVLCRRHGGLPLHFANE